MRGYPLIIAFIVVFKNAVAHGHPFHTRSRSTHNPIIRDSCSYTCNNLASLNLLTLSRTLDEKEEPIKEIVTAPALFNADELIMKLVNALVYATTHRAENHCHCHCPHSVKSSDDSRNNAGVIPSSNLNNGHSNDGLLNLDLLNSNKRDNLLDLDLSNQHLIGVGLGGKSQDQSSYASSSAYSSTYSNEPVISTGRTSSTSNSDGLNKVAEVNLGKQNVVGIGLLDEAYGNRKQGYTGEGLVNLDVLNPKKDNNVAELALGQQKVLGVGLGGSNNIHN